MSATPVVNGPSAGPRGGWTTLEHNGVLFPPLYVPHRVPLLYDGEPVVLCPEQEEVATFYGEHLLRREDRGGAAAAASDVERRFQHNFFRGFLEAGLGNGIQFESLERCDFSRIVAHLRDEREARRAERSSQLGEAKRGRSTEEEKREFGIALVDGEEVEVANYCVEPPGLFLGRGSHPLAGVVKERIWPCDVTINCGEEAVVPECPHFLREAAADGQVPLEKLVWKEIIHDPSKRWLASWRSPVLATNKYVFLSREVTGRAATKPRANKYVKAAVPSSKEKTDIAPDPAVLKISRPMIDPTTACDVVVPQLAQLRIQFVHGGGWNPSRPNDSAQWPLEWLERRCADATMARCLDTTDFASVVEQVAREMAQFRPDVLVGKSQGGPTILKLIHMGLWRGPVVLLCPALFFGFDDFVIDKKANTSLVACLGKQDLAVPPHVGESLLRENSARATAGEILLEVVDDGHALKCLSDEALDPNLGSLIQSATRTTLVRLGVRAWSEVDAGDFSATPEEVEQALASNPEAKSVAAGAPCGAEAQQRQTHLSTEVRGILESSEAEVFSILARDLTRLASRVAIEGWLSSPPSSIEFNLKDAVRKDRRNHRKPITLGRFLEKYAASHPSDAATLRSSLQKMAETNPSLLEDTIDPVLLFHGDSFWTPFGLPAPALRAVLDEAVRLQDVWNSHSRSAAGFDPVLDVHPSFSSAASRHLSLSLSAKAVSLLSSSSMEITMDDSEDIFDVLGADDNDSHDPSGGVNAGNPASEVARVLSALQARLGCDDAVTESEFETMVRAALANSLAGSSIGELAQETAQFLTKVAGRGNQMCFVLKLLNQRISFLAMKSLRIAASSRMGDIALHLLVPRMDSWRVMVAFSYNLVKVTHIRTEVARDSFEWPFEFDWALTCTLKREITNTGGTALTFVSCTVRTTRWGFGHNVPAEKCAEIRQAFSQVQAE